MSDKAMLKVAKWYNDYECAISLRFDDNLASHVRYVIPLLNKYGLKATFMINPGRNFKRYKDFWENEVPKMGHKLGNHTWHHTGAKNLEQAEFEIGEVSKHIWKLYPNETKLNVFASGGGETWGGRRWHRTLPEYREIPMKYDLIDLYDGKHKGLELNSYFSGQEIEKFIGDAVRYNKHLALVFHKIGKKNFKDYLRKIIKNYNYTFGKIQFLDLVNYLNSKKDLVWVATLIQIYKYETEYESSKINLISKKTNLFNFEMLIGTDYSLYDHVLSLILPIIDNMQPMEIRQNNEKVKIRKNSNGKYIADVKPISSKIMVSYDNQ